MTEIQGDKVLGCLWFMLGLQMEHAGPRIACLVIGIMYQLSALLGVHDRGAR